jgi:hypothetical protein
MNNQEKLEQRVRDYLSSHVYKGYSKPFELDRIHESPINHRVLWVEPKGMDYEDICTIDRKWEQGLADVGAELGKSLRLPVWAYAK